MKVPSSQLTLSYKSDNLKPRNSSTAEWHEKKEETNENKRLQTKIYAKIEDGA
jgi:hypothetical protein